MDNPAEPQLPQYFETLPSDPRQQPRSLLPSGRVINIGFIAIVLLCSAGIFIFQSRRAPPPVSITSPEPLSSPADVNASPHGQSARLFTVQKSTDIKSITVNDTLDDYAIVVAADISTCVLLHRGKTVPYPCTDKVVIPTTLSKPTPKYLGTTPLPSDISGVPYLSPTGEFVGYVRNHSTASGTYQSFVYNGTESGQYTDIRSVTFSGDFTRYALIGRRWNETLQEISELVLDGRVIDQRVNEKAADRDRDLANPVFTPDGKFIYTRVEYGNDVIIVDGNKTGIFPRIQQTIVSPDGNHLAFLTILPQNGPRFPLLEQAIDAKNNPYPQQHLFVDFHKQTTVSVLSPIRFSEDSTYLYYYALKENEIWFMADPVRTSGYQSLAQIPDLSVSHVLYCCDYTTQCTDHTVASVYVKNAAAFVKDTHLGTCRFTGYTKDADTTQYKDANCMQAWEQTQSCKTNTTALCCPQPPVFCSGENAYTTYKKYLLRDSSPPPEYNETDLCRTISDTSYNENGLYSDSGCSINFDKSNACALAVPVR